MSMVLDAPLALDNAPTGTRLAQIPEGRKHYKPLKTAVDRFAAAFGKPPRLIASDCERTNETAMPQAFQLISGPLVQELLTRSTNRIATLLTSEKNSDELVDEIFWTTLSREPSAPERERAIAHLSADPDRRKATEDLFWALLNSKEFVFRR
jgi:hypothetical protein